ncbi:MAG: RNA polymerase sigma factor [Armatimonadetes bacterium]|nr:RNA polymerase sigma factor [Armatimonadota bacterium]MCX7969047.1 RNA polymerase sigma factor [Armatimonadota bacterium]MDW8142846.1 RNA polymerase sigma factor [Armatimonadota bacterium]
MLGEDLRCSEICNQVCHRFGTEDCCQYCPERVRELCRKFQLCKGGECLCSDTDTLLMAAFADGDEIAFCDLYRRNLEWARKLAFKFLGNWQDACDLAQEAFLRVIANRDRWKPEAKFKTWFHRIVVNLSLKRRNFPVEVESLDEFDETKGSAGEIRLTPVVESPETNLLAAEQMRLLQLAIESLPKRQRQALVLWSQGASYQQIAQHLGCSLSAVETLLHRAKRNLRKILDAAND